MLNLMYSCKGSQECACSSQYVIYDSPYDSPVCYPLGQLIGFNHTPVNKIEYLSINRPECNCLPVVQCKFESDSAGFWLINTDGSNMHRALPYKLDTPAWSKDGKWIVFSKEGQLCMMSFDGEKFDTTSIIAIPLKGHNYFPSWSWDGKKIAYNQNICNDTITCGVWVYNFETNQTESIGIYTKYPNWQPTTDSLIYFSSDLTINNISIYKQGTNRILSQLLSPIVDSKYLEFSHDGKIIAFVSKDNINSGEQLYKINANGSGFTKLTSDFCSQFSWSPNNKIVYVNYNFVIDKTKGTLWIMDADGENKKPLTYNNAIITKN